MTPRGDLKNFGICLHKSFTFDREEPEPGRSVCERARVGITSDYVYSAAQGFRNKGTYQRYLINPNVSTQQHAVFV